MPRRKRFTSMGTRKRKNSESGDDSENKWQNQSTLSRQNTKITVQTIQSANNWVETDLKKIGIYYEKSGYWDFNEVLDTCPLVCTSLPPLANEILTLLSDCLNFDLKLEKFNGRIEGADRLMTSNEVIECLKSAQVKLDEQYVQYFKFAHEFGIVSSRIKYQSLHSAEMFIKGILMHVHYLLQKTQQPVTEDFSTMMVSCFGSMCNLCPRPSFYKHTMCVKGQVVSSMPDVRFEHADEPGLDSVLTVSVFKRKRTPQKRGDKEENVLRWSDSSVSTDEKSQKFNIHNFVGEDFLGKHGIELLIESLFSAKQHKQREASYIFGLIVVGVQVIFTCLYVTDNEVRSIIDEDDGYIAAPGRGIKYSKPFNILSSSDRRQAYEILFRLSEKIELSNVNDS